MCICLYIYFFICMCICLYIYIYIYIYIYSLMTSFDDCNSQKLTVIKHYLLCTYNVQIYICRYSGMYILGGVYTNLYMPMNLHIDTQSYINLYILVIVYIGIVFVDFYKEYSLKMYVCMYVCVCVCVHAYI